MAELTFVPIKVTKFGSRTLNVYVWHVLILKLFGCVVNVSLDGAPLVTVTVLDPPLPPKPPLLHEIGVAAIVDVLL